MAEPLPEDRITIYYGSQEQLEKKLIAILSAFGYEVYKEQWETYEQIRPRYPHLTATAFWNRIHRLPFPVPIKTETGPKRSRIRALVVTPALDRYLAAPLYDRSSKKQTRSDVGQARRPSQDRKKGQGSAAQSAEVLEQGEGRRSSQTKSRLAKGKTA